jgi:hypothetical protein
MDPAVILNRAKQFDLACVETVDLNGLPLATGLSKSVLGFCTSLRTISLRGCLIDSLAGIEALAGTLTRLDIGNNKISRLDACVALSRLTDLVADNNKISVDAVSAIAPLAGSLVLLDLRGNPSSAAAASSNASRALALFPKLLLLDGCPVEVQRLTATVKPAPAFARAVGPASAGDWLPAAGLPATADPSSKLSDQLEASVRRFKLVSQRAEEAIRKTRAAH